MAASDNPGSEGTEETGTNKRAGVSRRAFLESGALFGAGAVAALGIEAIGRAVGGVSGTDAAVSGPSASTVQADGPALESIGQRAVPFYGPHQAGIEATPQAAVCFIAFDLLADTDAAAIRRMLRLITDDAQALTAGRAPVADSEPELATVPAGLTVTVGFGPELVRRVAGEAAVPAWLGPLPAFPIDALEDQWCGGDLLVEVAADARIVVAHAERMITRDIRSLATVRWRQEGFRDEAGLRPAGTTMRNLFGQVDGTTNPLPGTESFTDLVYARDGWLAGGSSLVLRRIRMNLDTWDEVDRPAREQAVGRNLATGAPLTGAAEHDEPDFDALDPLGFPVISPVSHLRRARSDNPREKVFRRAASYQVTGPDGSTDAGLLFASYQADVAEQFIPIQSRLAEFDLLNFWTVPIGSAVFALPPGCSEGGFLGETLFS